MDGAQEVERIRATRIVSANVDMGVRRRVSFGEPKNGSEVGEARLAWRHECAKVGMARADTGSGQTVLELALLLPVLLLLLVGVIEIGRYAYFDILVSNAARAGAQYGAQSLIQAADVNGIIAAAQNDGLGTMKITPLQQCGCNGGGAPAACPVGGSCPPVYIKVTASDTYNSLFNYPGLPKSLTLSSTVTMRVSQ